MNDGDEGQRAEVFRREAAQLIDDALGMISATDAAGCEQIERMRAVMRDLLSSGLAEGYRRGFVDAYGIGLAEGSRVHRKVC